MSMLRVRLFAALVIATGVALGAAALYLALSVVRGTFAPPPGVGSVSVGVNENVLLAVAVGTWAITSYLVLLWTVRRAGAEPPRWWWTYLGIAACSVVVAASTATALRDVSAAAGSDRDMVIESVASAERMATIQQSANRVYLLLCGAQLVLVAATLSVGVRVKNTKASP